MEIPVIPTFYTVIVFVVLCLLLIHKEIRRAVGQTGSQRWRWFTNATVGLLLVVYGTILLSRFLFLLR